MRGVIQWCNFHPRPQCLLADEQVQGRALVIIRPVLSRWTSHAAAAKQFVKLSIPLQSLVLRKREELLAKIENRNLLLKQFWILYGTLYFGAA